MIKSWKLEGFKSVAEQVTLEFAPLTIFAGANSSGKSTIIQSILLSSQTLQSSASSNSVVLNGHILRLGEFDDVLSDYSDERDVSVGFTLDSQETTLSVFDPFLPLRYQRGIRFRGRYSSLENAMVTCNFSFSTIGDSADKEVLQLHPELKDCSIEVDVREEDIYDRVAGFQARRSSRKLSEIAEGLDIPLDDLEIDDARSIRYELIEPKEVEDRGSYMRGPAAMASGELAGVAFRHFLPRRLVEVYDETEEYYRRLVAYLTGDTRYMLYRFASAAKPDLSATGPKFKELVMAEFEQVLDRADPERPRYPKLKRAVSRMEDEFSFENLRTAQNSLYKKQESRIKSAFRTKRDDLYRAARASRKAVYALRYLPLPTEVDPAVDYIQSFFTQNVKYLGPLRVEPKPIYSLPGAIDSKDIGIRGEHTATVLDVHSDSQVAYIAPRAMEELGEDTEPNENSLLEATLDWLQYLGIASDIRTLDKGKIGRELKVAPDKQESLHDLIHVGVGVSQVLPIVVVSLLADPGSTLIFEQPELHLHPKVQVRLADFFLSMSYLGKQCIVETHSEYMIDRLRLRSAKSNGNQVSSRVIIYFVEKVDNQSQFNQIMINQYGVIENWPSGFFDESERTSADILRAGIQKRRSEESEEE